MTEQSTSYWLNVKTPALARDEARVRACTLPLLATKPRRAPELIGTGVALKLGEEYFILTAGHVIDDFAEREFLTAHAGEIRPFACRAERNVPPGQSREDDLVDVGVLGVVDGGALGIDEACLRAGDLAMREWQRPATVGHVFGYPCSKFRTDASTRQVTFGHFAYTSERILPGEMQGLGRHAMSHIALAFDPRFVEKDGKRTNPPEVKCVSGAGMWAMPRYQDAMSLAGPQLLAILTDRVRDGKALIGTRVAWHAELIRMRWPQAGKLLGTHGGLELSATPVDAPSPPPNSTQLGDGA